MQQTQPSLDDPLLPVIGYLTAAAQNPPLWASSPTAALFWRAGYQNAMSDLIAQLWPEADGGRRLTAQEIEAEDARRGV